MHVDRICQTRSHYTQYNSLARSAMTVNQMNCPDPNLTPNGAHGSDIKGNQLSHRVSFVQLPFS